MSSSAAKTHGQLNINELSRVHEELINIASKWKYFGGNVGVLPAELSNIERSNTDFDEKLYKVLEYRLKQLPLLTWHDIVRALRSPAVHEHVLASQIESQYIPTTLLSPQSPSGRALTGKRSFSQLSVGSSAATAAHMDLLETCVQPEMSVTPSKRPHLEPEALLSHSDPKTLFNKFIEGVKSLYRSSSVEKRTEVLKLPTPGNKFINLACIDRKTEGLKTEYDEITEAMVRHGNVDVIEGRKCPIDMDKIAANLPQTPFETVILVEGAPGVGKSTFASEFCRRWGEGEIAKHYCLVLLLQLRDESMRVVTDWRDLVYHSSKIVRQAVISEIESRSGYGVLFILEGYDELPDECRDPCSPFLKLISGKDLAFATLLITSRPWATCDILKKFKQRVFQHIEVLGFTKQQIRSYLKDALSDEDAESLEKTLLKHEQIRMGMYIPLNCAIVVTVYQESKDSGDSMPNSLTELYSAVSRKILLRYLHASGIDSDPMECFDELPPVAKKKFSYLCELAYNGIAGEGDHVKLIFSQLPSDFDNLGFMDSVYELYVTRKRVASHNFLHLTFQEFLAAVHISGLEHNKQLEHFKRHKEGRLRVVLRFLAGLTHMKDFSVLDFKDVLDDEDYTDNDSISIDYSVSTQLSWINEAQRGELVMKSFNEDETVEYTCRDQFDSSALGYCIANSCCKWVLVFEREISEDDMRVFVAEVKSNESSGGVIIGLSAAFDDSVLIPLNALNLMFEELKESFCLEQLAVLFPAECSKISWPDLSSLRVLNIFVKEKNSLGLNSLLPNLSLKELKITAIYDCTLTKLDCEAIANFICENKTLEELSFDVKDDVEDDWEVEDLRVIFKALTRNDSLPLKTLDLGGISYIGDEGVEELVEFLQQDSNMYQLHLKDNNISDVGAEHLAKILCANSSLTALLMSNNNIGDEGAEYLASALCFNKTLEVLDLYNNGIGSDGAKALAKALHFNCTLKHLDLRQNPDIGEDGLQHLLQALTVNDSIGVIQKKLESGLWLDKAAYKNAIKYPEYSIVKHRVNFSTEVGFVTLLCEQRKSKVSTSEPEESVIYIGKACSYISQTGISLHFPAAKCPTPIKVSVKVVNGEYTLPPEYEGMPLVSSMFKITASDTLPAPITVRMEHCAVVERDDSLVHMIAEDTQPYRFKELPGGEFPIGGSYGEIKLEKFSIFTTICKVLGLYLDLSISLFYHKDDTATFVATRNLHEVIAAVKEKFAEAVETLEKSMIYYCYTTRAITLTIPEDKPGGWSVVPQCKPPKIEKELICSFEKGKTPPSIQLKMKWTGRKPPKEEDIEIELNGCSVESFTLSCKPSHNRMAQSQRQQSCTNSQFNHSTQWIKPYPEFRALQKCNDLFTRSLDPENLAPVLYSRGLLTLQEKERATQQTSTSSQKLDEIFKGMMRRVCVNPQCFKTILEALSEEQANTFVAKRIKGNNITIIV